MHKNKTRKQKSNAPVPRISTNARLMIERKEEEANVLWLVRGKLRKIEINAQTPGEISLSLSLSLSLSVRRSLTHDRMTIGFGSVG